MVRSSRGWCQIRAVRAGGEQMFWGEHAHKQTRSGGTTCVHQWLESNAVLTLSKETCQSLSALKYKHTQTHGAHRELTCSVFTLMSRKRGHDQYLAAICSCLQSKSEAQNREMSFKGIVLFIHFYSSCGNFVRIQ